MEEFIKNVVLPLVINIATLLLLLAPGVILKKCRLVGEEFGKGLSNLVLYVAQPLLIFCAYLDYSGDARIWSNALWVLILSLLAHTLFAVVALLFFRGAEEGRRRMLRFATVFSNSAYMGIPLISAVLGAEATIYASIYNIVFNVFLWSFGVWLCTTEEARESEKKPLSAIVLKVAVHPVNIAAVLGLLCLAFNASAYLPPVVADILGGSFAYLKNLVAPLSMIIIGLRLATTSFRGAFRDRYLYLLLALRHLLLPAVLLVLLHLLAYVIPLGDTVNEVVIILAATPAATAVTMFAEKYGCDTAYASRSVLISTLLAVVTMPLVVLAYGLLF